MPLTVPRGRPKTVAATSALPAAVLAVCVPCPLSSRAESNSESSAPMRARYVGSTCRAPTSLLLHRNGASAGLCAVLPNSHGIPGATSASGNDPSSAKLGCSGQMPVSMTPTTTPLPSSPVS